ncbi:PqqD family protein [Streptomyces sp. AJS327]|uniref:PqqD family peptide modification chaperone n=1 Tax=Streptomyces sp. AJS327 TaxID=2545265 RepID=UPI0015DF029C|nr:PqqD family peptide modification chaperone [Streptomyces sp. AJS327]MBA0053633.1 PqqD family protein [Streptomyces sp. AJS327]
MWRLHERTHPALTDEGGALLDEHTGRWIHLTPTATAAVLLLLSSTSQQQAADRFAERYGIPRSRAADDVGAVADVLTAQGLATRAEAQPSRRRPRWGWRR